MPDEGDTRSGGVWTCTSGVFAAALFSDSCTSALFVAHHACALGCLAAHRCLPGADAALHLSPGLVFSKLGLAMWSERVYYVNRRKSLDSIFQASVKSWLSRGSSVVSVDAKKGVVEMTGAKIALDEGTEPGRTAAVGGGFPR